MDTTYLRLFRRLKLLGTEDEENIDFFNILANAPLRLDSNDPVIEKAGLILLPFRTGFELECFQASHYDEEEFSAIPDILDVNVDEDEQRYQIPSGITGLKCLYNICQALKRNSLIDPNSGIHYHVDFTDYYEYVNNIIYSDKFKDTSNYLLNELEDWNYSGTYNSRCVSIGHNWIRFNSGTKTMEYRIGEMTFDYTVMFRRIVHANYLTRYTKEQFDIIRGVLDPLIRYEEEDVNEIIKTRIQKLR